MVAPCRDQPPLLGGGAAAEDPLVGPRLPVAPQRLYARCANLCGSVVRGRGGQDRVQDHAVVDVRRGLARLWPAEQNAPALWRSSLIGVRQSDPGVVACRPVVVDRLAEPEPADDLDVVGQRPIADRLLSPESGRTAAQTEDEPPALGGA